MTEAQRKRIYALMRELDSCAMPLREPELLRRYFKELLLILANELGETSTREDLKKIVVDYHNIDEGE